MSDVPALDDYSILEGEHVVSDPEPVSGERAAWLACILRAYGDAFLASDAWIKNSDRTCEPDQVRAESRRWLVHNFGTWKQDREEVCELAGIDPDMLREAARKRLAAIKAGEVATAEVANLDLVFQRLLDSEESISAGEIDSALSELATLEMAA